MPKFWTVRVGRYYERVDWCLSNGYVGGGWTSIPDLTDAKSREDVREIVSEAITGTKNQIANRTGQLWALRGLIKPGDYVALPIRSTAQIIFGEVTGPYQYLKKEEDPSKRHVLPVKWFDNQVPKSLVKQDLLYQLGSALTVFRVSNNDADYRLSQLMKGKPDPGVRLNTESNAQPEESIQESFENESGQIDHENVASDAITRLLHQEFKGHDLSELVEALLTAEGYVCRNSPPGADGGVDILAGKGPLGMDSPKLVVQVKSQTSNVGDQVLQQLNGAIHRFQADQALLVAFGGVTGPAEKFLETQYFNVRVWKTEDILDGIYKHYEILPGEMKAKLPLKQIWVPVPESD